VLKQRRRHAAVSVILSAGLAVAGALAMAPAANAASLTLPDSGTVGGVDVSSTVDWSTAPTGTQFAYIEAMNQGMKLNSSFYANWAGATQAGLARGAYAFGTPNKTASNGATQAAFFYANGGALSTANPYSLPPVLDLEEQSGATTAAGSCWNLTVAEQQNWVTSFITTFKSLSGVTPVIYTTKSYWTQCVGNPLSLSKYPLWAVDTATGTFGSPGFGGATTWKFRQFALNQSGFDYDEFHGSLAALKAFSNPRFSGTDRWSTGLAAALSFAPGVDTVFAASGANYPDALAAGAAAGKHGGPVLLVPPSGSLPSSVKQALSYLKPKHIVVVGGTTAVSSGIQTALKPYSASVTRVAGADRSATSAALATGNFSKGVANAYIALGTGWPDALSGSALAASAKGSGPVLLVNQGSIPSSVAKALWSLRPQHIYVLGGTAVVSSAVQSALKAYTASGSASAVTRLAGSDRWGTSVAIAKRLAAESGASGEVFAASGAAFPDALVGAPVAALSSSPLLLVPPTSATPSSVKSEISALKPSKLAIMGGKAAVSASVQSTLSALVH